MNDVLELTQTLEQSTETTMIGTEECMNNVHVQYLCKHARTMCMMYKATGESRYLTQARLSVRQAKSIKESGFIRPMGVLLAG